MAQRPAPGPRPRAGVSAGRGRIRHAGAGQGIARRHLPGLGRVRGEPAMTRPGARSRDRALGRGSTSGAEGCFVQTPGKNSTPGHDGSDYTLEERQRVRGPKDWNTAA